MTKIRNEIRANCGFLFASVIRILDSKFVSSFGLPRRDLMRTVLRFIATPIVVLMMLFCTPGLGRGFRVSNLVWE
jgi:hypothetical protein